jgi:hypothetical protein
MNNFLYMVEMTVPDYPTDDFFEIIPEHRSKVHELMLKDIIVSYSLAGDRSKLWVIIKAGSESELLMHIESLPLTKYLDYTYNELMFMEMMPMKMSFSLN